MKKRKRVTPDKVACQLGLSEAPESVSLRAAPRIRVLLRLAIVIIAMWLITILFFTIRFFNSQICQPEIKSNPVDSQTHPDDFETDVLRERKECYEIELYRLERFVDITGINALIPIVTLIAGYIAGQKERSKK